MRRYRLPVDPVDLGRITIDGDLFHHIFDVCRLDVGSKFELLDSSGRAHFVEVSDLGKKHAVAKTINSRDLPALPEPHLVLALSVPRFPILESVIEKCVELGVKEVRLFFSKNSFVRTSEKISEGKWERWQKIILSATQQSGRGDLMKLHPAVPLDELLKSFQPDANRENENWGLVAYEGEVPQTARDLLSRNKMKTQAAKNLWFFVGSEGGFHLAELGKLESVGIEAATLGEQVLRVETACITLAAILKYEVGHFGGKHGGAG